MFNPIPALNLEHRVVMAPCTRLRASDRFVCGPTAVQYYGERASKGGLLITEASPVCPETQYEYSPGIYTAEQEAGWKKVVDAVHAKGGLISIQLWHLGRLAHVDWANDPFLRSLGRPLPSASCSPTTPPGHSRGSDGKKRPHGQARELTREDITVRLVNDFKLAAEAAKRCGFDFVEVHCAHGYLFDQFFCSSTNFRGDEFGAQNTVNRTRALSLVLDAVINVFDGDSKRVGVRVSPTSCDTFSYQGCKDSNPEATYRGIVQHLNHYKLAYLLITEARWSGGRSNFEPRTDQTFRLPVRNAWVREVYDGIVIGSSSFTPQTGSQAIEDGVYDAIAFGRFFISNPDLPARIRAGHPLNVYDTKTFYSRDDKRGYTDYPSYHQRGRFPQITESEIGATKPPPRAKKPRAKL